MEQQKTHEPGMAEIGAHMKEDIAQLRDAAERRRREMYDEVRKFVDEHPVAAVGAAFGAGYLLSGALFSRATAKVLTLGARFYLDRLWSSALGYSAMGESVAAGAADAGPAANEPRRPRGPRGGTTTNPTGGGNP